MSAMGILLRIARAVVESVIRTIAQQVQLLQEAVTNPLNALVQAVVGGMWRGSGANTFVNEMTSEIVPELVAIGAVGTSFSGAINDALGIMNQAESKAMQQGQSLYEIFQNIYRG